MGAAQCVVCVAGSLCTGAGAGAAAVAVAGAASRGANSQGAAAVPTAFACAKRAPHCVQAEASPGETLLQSGQRSCCSIDLRVKQGSATSNPC